MKQKSAFEISEKMRRIESAGHPPTPEDEESVARLLQRHDCLDLAAMLGLQVTNSESSNDSKLPAPVVR